MPRISVSTDARLHKFAARTAGGLNSEQALDKLFAWLIRQPDPDETLRKLGKTRVSLRALEFDDEISQCLDTRREAVIATPWRLEPQQPRSSKWLATQIAPHFEALVRAAFSAVCYGYSVIEVVYGPADGKIGIDHLAEKPLEWFVPQRDGTVRYFPNNGSGGVTGIEVDARKFILTRRQPSYRNPYGEALLSRLYWPYFFKTQGRRFWAQFLERFGFPILVGTVSDGAAFVEAMTRLGAVSPVAIPPGSTVETIAATQAGEFERFDATFARSIQKVILGQTLTSDVGSSGSYAAAKVHDSVREDKRNADIRLVSATVQELVNILAELNGLQAVQFVMADGTGLEVERATRDATLVDKGVLKFTEQYLLDRYDFLEGDFTVPTTPVPAPPAPPALPAPAAEPEDEPAAAALAAFAAPRFTAEQQVLEDGIDSVLQRLDSVIADAEIKAVIRLATSPRDLHDRLMVLLAGADGADFQRTFERALFAADVLGYAHAGAP